MVHAVWGLMLPVAESLMTNMYVYNNITQTSTRIKSESALYTLQYQYTVNIAMIANAIDINI